MVKKGPKDTKSYQIKMDENVHSLLKRRAKASGMTIGEFIQNMLSTLERRAEVFKTSKGFDTSIINDELDAKLIKLLLLKDYGELTDQDVDLKFDKFKDRYQASSYKPDFTISDEDV